LPAELATWPAWTPGEGQLGELELITSGAFAPLTGYLAAADLAAVSARGELADGTPWPVPVTLTVPAAAVPAAADRLVLQDQEGSPLAVVSITERSPAAADGSTLRLAGPVTALRAPEHGPFRALRAAPAAVRAALGAGPVLAYATRRPLGQRQIGQLRHLAGRLRARILLLPLVSGPADIVTRPESLVRAVRAAAVQLPEGTLVVPVPLPPRDDPAEELRARAVVAAAYGATHLLAEGGRDSRVSRTRSDETDFGLSRLGVKILAEGEWAYDPSAEVWRPLGLIEPGMERGELSDAELGELLDSGRDLPAWLVPASVAQELRRARPSRARRGVVVFFTGLSGSGKSTLARDLRDALVERGDRTVSLLDGDQVRRLLSAGLTFSREDRDLNIARIGYVAAEVARHGGIAICAPIAPYAAARAVVRKMVSEVGDLVLVHVATPLEVCEARDRKGLYAQARAGIIGSFTGISDPYEEPDDADLVIDTSTVSRHDAVAAVLAHLTRGGWLSLSGGAVRPCSADGLFLVFLVLGRGALFEALAELGDLRAGLAEPPVEPVRDDLALLVQQDVAGEHADEQAKEKQQDAAGPGHVQQDHRAPEHQDAGRRVGKDAGPGFALHSTTQCRTLPAGSRSAGSDRCCHRRLPRRAVCPWLK
jgi:sulfate adenylyltransferase